MKSTRQLRMTLVVIIACLSLVGCGKPVPTTGTIGTTQTAATIPSVPATTQAPATEPDDTADLLIGSWHKDVYWGDCMELTYYTFASDGTLTCEDQFLTPTESKSERYTYGTYWERGFQPANHGTYTVAGNRLTVCYTAVDPETLKETAVTNTYFIQLLDGVLHLTDTKTGETEQFHPGAFPAADAVAPEVELSPLSGAWASIRDGGDEAEYRGNHLVARTIYFYSNGTFTLDKCIYEYKPNWRTGAWGWEHYRSTDRGTFTYDGTTLVLIFPDQNHIIRDEYVKTYTITGFNDTHLIIDDQWGTYINTKTVPYEGLEGLCNALGVEYAPVEYDYGDETP